MSTREYLRFQQNLKKSALGIRFGKTLLTNPNSLSAKQITGILRTMGLPISREMEILPDAAQAITLGAATITKAREGVEIGQLIKPGVASISTLTRIGNELGLVDDRTAAQIAVAGDVALIFASGGLDVGAWMRVGMAVMQESARADAEAGQKALINAIGQASAAQQKQADKFLANVKEMQAGELGIFSFLVENAVDCPLIFDNVIGNNPIFDTVRNIFPGLKLFPKTSYYWQGSGSSQTWYGENRDKVETFTMEGLARMTIGEAADVLIRGTMGPSMEFYQDMRSFYMGHGKPDIFKLAPLALFEERFVMGNNSNLLERLIKLQLTPLDLGIENTFKNAVTVKQYTGVLSNFGLTAVKAAMPEDVMNYYDKIGNLKPLLNDKQARTAIDKKLNLDIGTFPRNAPTAFAWDDFGNFISILDFADFISKDPKFNEFAKQSSWIRFLQSFPLINDFKASYRLIYEKSMLRRVNGAAAFNAATLLGTTPSKMKTNIVEGQATIFS